MKTDTHPLAPKAVEEMDSLRLYPFKLMAIELREGLTLDGDTALLDFVSTGDDGARLRIQVPTESISALVIGGIYHPTPRRAASTEAETISGGGKPVADVEPLAAKTDPMEYASKIVKLLMETDRTTAFAALEIARPLLSYQTWPTSGNPGA